MKTAKKKMGASAFSAEFVNSLVSSMQSVLEAGALRDSKFRQQLLTELVAAYVASQGGTSMEVRWATEGLIQAFELITAHHGKPAQATCSQG